MHKDGFHVLYMRDNQLNVVMAKIKKLGEYSILVVECLAKHEVIRMGSQKGFLLIIV